MSIHHHSAAHSPAPPGRIRRRTGGARAITAIGALSVALAACDPATARGEGEADRPQSAESAESAGRATADSLDAASIDVGHTLGDPRAPIAVVEFSDFGCPYCGRFARGTLPEIRADLIDRGVVRWRYVPVTFGFPGGQVMGAAAECAAVQGGGDTFWRVHDLFYERQVALRGEDARARILDWLAQLGLDRVALDRCVDAPTTHALLDRHNRIAGDWYIRGTPTFLVNGVPMSGALPIEFFRKVFGTVLDPSGL